jgi:hypothetical protein
VRPADEPLYTTEHAVPQNRDARWLARRARNVARRPLVLLLFASGGFLAALLAIITAPIGIERVQPRVLVPERVDTASLQRSMGRAQSAVAIAEAALAASRADTFATLSPIVRDTFPPALRDRRDSLGLRAREIAVAVRRATDAPLPASYRTVGELPELAMSGVAPILDSLGVLERSRNATGMPSGADTTFMALTAEVSRLGDSLVDLAERELQRLRRELATLTPQVTTPLRADTVDTMPFRMALDDARASFRGAEARLASARAHNLAAGRLEARARQGRARAASPPLRIAAAGAIGAAFGFLLALAGEMRRPSIADAREAEVAAGVPVLAHVPREVGSSQRARRKADLDVPPLIELTTDRYDRLYHRLADAVARLPRLAILGDHPAVVATVASNLAAVAARTARATLLLDTDFDSGSVAAVLRVRPEPGVAEVLAKRLHWSSAVTHAVVGRSRVVDVLPAGRMKGGASLASVADSFGAEVANISRRYDTVIISAPASRRGAVTAVAAAVADAIVCVRTARTSVRLLQRLVEDARRDGVRIRGVVLWDRDDVRDAGRAARELSATSPSVG